MGEHHWLAERFEEHRAHLRAVAYRMLGSTGEADDAVQEAWLRVSRAGTNSSTTLISCSSMADEAVTGLARITCASLVVSVRSGQWLTA
jgi:hypothetical protein